MIGVAHGIDRVRYPMLAISALAWIALAAGRGLHVPGAHLICSAAGVGPPSTAVSLAMLLALNPPSALAAGWALMLAAMMSPLVVTDIQYIRFTSLARRRARSIALFLAGYGGVWMLSGALLVAAGVAARVLAPGSYVPAIAAGFVAFAWQASPLKQRCLNACHATRPMRAFGREADLDAVGFGWTRGLWCAASCGWLMLIPMLLPEGHLVAMAAVALLMFCERLEDPAPPQWKLRGFAKAARIVAARARIRWRRWIAATAP